MGAEVVNGSIVTISTGEVKTPTEPVTTTQGGDNTSTGAVEFPSGPVVTGSHWADILDRSEAEAAEPAAKQISATVAENKSVKPGRR